MSVVYTFLPGNVFWGLCVMSGEPVGSCENLLCELWRSLFTEGAVLRLEVVVKRAYWPVGFRVWEECVVWPDSVEHLD